MNTKKNNTYTQYILFSLFILISSKTWAQNNLDSLFGVWQNRQISDSIRVDAFLDYIQAGAFYSQPDSAVILLKQAYDFSENSQDTIAMIDALNMAGYNFFRMGKYPDALAKYKKGLALAEIIEDDHGAGSILMRTGYIYHDNEDLVKALQYYERSLKLFEAINDLNGIGSIYNEFGNIYKSKGDFDKSLDYYSKSIAINDSLYDDIGSAAQLSNIGLLYTDHNKFNEALDYQNRALGIYRAVSDKLGIANTLSAIGDIHHEMEAYDVAIDFYVQSSKISEEIDDIQGLAATLASISEIFSVKGKHNLALGYCNKSLMLSKQLGDLGGIEQGYDCLYENHKALGNQTKALLYLEEMLVYKDSLKTEEASAKLQQMEFAKQVLADSLLQVEKEMKIEMAHQAEVRKKDRNRNVAIAAGLFFVVLSGGLYHRWRFVKKSKIIIEKERDRSESLLLNILPSAIAEELKEKGEAAARDFELATILFSDFKGFTQKAEKLTAKELIEEINICFKAFDQICEKYGIEKIKTIGDAYMAAGGLPVPDDAAVTQTVMAALEMQSFISNRIKERKEKKQISFEMRVGIHTGPVVAGIVGIKKFQYDIWGDTVNIASRMESNGAIAKVNISQNTYDLLKDNAQFVFEPRGKIEVKGKGAMEMWFVDYSKK
ncbi:MAG: tetratricopeptide repeat protein [Croceitalea sp.]|nr:tetratricopeptide repeat protein [Croceitalea sp.]